MQFTGHNLALVREGLSLALMELHNEIATCPDVIKYAEDLDDIRAKQIKVQKLIDRIDRGGSNGNIENMGAGDVSDQGRESAEGQSPSMPALQPTS